MKQDDLEIYLKSINLETVTSWLTHVFGECSPWQQKGKVYKCIVANNIPITWYEKAVGSWHCMHIEINDTPWADDTECAKAASEFLKTAIRCAPNSWTEQANEPEDQANQWLEINNQTISHIIWYT